MSEDTLMARLHEAVRRGFPSPALEESLEEIHGGVDELRHDFDRLAIQIEQLLRERAQIVETLTAFYRSDLSMASVHPILDLARQLNPTLDERPVRS
jgi:hypothetical protein